MVTGSLQYVINTLFAASPQILQAAAAALLCAGRGELRHGSVGDRAFRAVHIQRLPRGVLSVHHGGVWLDRYHVARHQRPGLHPGTNSTTTTSIISSITSSTTSSTTS